MFWLLLLIWTILVVGAYIIWSLQLNYKINKICIILSGLLTVLIIGATVLGIIILSNATRKEYVAETQQLYALQDSNSIQGRFFLGFGDINGVKEVSYAIKNKDNTISIKSVNMDTNKVVFKENDEKALKIYKTKFENPKIIWWFGSIESEDEKYEFNVPKGSITTDFNIDLK